jgi:hypothetical protein
MHGQHEAISSLTCITAISPCRRAETDLWQALGTYLRIYKAELLPGIDPLITNLIGALQAFLVLALSPVVGLLLDAGHITHLLIFGTVAQGIGQFSLAAAVFTAQSGPVSVGPIIVTQGVVQPVGMACFFVTSSWGESVSLYDHTTLIRT